MLTSELQNALVLLRIVGWTLLAVTIAHGHTTGRWRELHGLGLLLATASIAGTQGH